jgi:hypothetical protein
MIRAAGILLAVGLLVPAAAGTSTARPAVALIASPARVTLLGSGQAVVRVRNTGSEQVVVDVVRAGFSLDLRGRPRIVPRGGARAADAWLSVRPRRLALFGGRSASLTVVARLPRRVEPGDHDALLVLTTRPRRAAGVAVRIRIGVLVVVRAPGRIVHRLELRSLRARKAGRTRLLELIVVNGGNVTETVTPGRVELLLRRRRVNASLRPEPRELRPRTSGIVQFRYRGVLRGWVTARATISLAPGAVTSRAYRLRL